MTPTIGAATSGSRPELISATYRQLLHRGFGTPEAANLTAVAFGLRITHRPWTVRELTQLFFLRQLRDAERAWADTDDRANSADPMPIPVLTMPTPSSLTARSSSAGPPHRGESDPSNDRVTLLTLFREMTGTPATLDLLRPSPTRRSRLDVAGGSDREGG